MAFLGHSFWTVAEFRRLCSEVQSIAFLEITTVTPEPSTFMMLGVDLLPVTVVIRRTYLNR
jgi:hypothetical protein